MLPAGVLFAVAAGALLAGSASGPAADLGALSRLALASSAAFACLALALALPGRRSVAEALGLRRSRLRRGATVLAAAGLCLLSLSLDRLVDLAGWTDASALGRIGRLVAAATPRQRVLALVGLALAPAVAEELLFRGALQRALLLRMPPAAAIGISALAFGLAHLDPVYVLAATALGLYLGVLAWRADSIRPAVICHLVNNTVAVLFAGPAAERLEPPAGLLPLVLLLSAGLLAAACRRPDPVLPAGDRAGEPEPDPRSDR